MSSNDEFLEFLVKKVEETGIGISITLSLKGLAVAGTMMRSQLYYEGVSRLLDDLNKPENFSTNNESDRELWRRYHESLKQYIEYMKEEGEMRTRGTLILDLYI